MWKGVYMKEGTGPVQSIDRVLDILETLSATPTGLSLSDLASATSLHASTAHRLLSALANRGYVRKDPDNGKYRLTLRLYEISRRVSMVLDLFSASKPMLEKLSNEEVRVRVIHSGVGAINESDVMLASTSNAVIVGFNVRPDNAARDSAERSKVELRMYRVIYDCINDVEAAMKGMLAPKFHEVIIGHAEVRQTFRVSKVGTVCGCYVQDGKIQRNCSVRVNRDNIVIFEGELASLRRFKDDVKEVSAGYECGMQVEKFNDIKEGDVIECFVNEQL